MLFLYRHNFQKTTDLSSVTFQLYHIKEIIEYETFTNISFYLSVCACGHMCGCPQRPEEGGVFPGTVTGSLELLGVGAGKIIRSSGRTVKDLNHWVGSKALRNVAF